MKGLKGLNCDEIYLLEAGNAEAEEDPKSTVAKAAAARRRRYGEDFIISAFAVELRKKKNKIHEKKAME